jgi:hypothetical protein
VSITEVANIVLAIAAILTLLFTGFQLRLLSHQMTVSSQAGISQAYGQVMQGMGEIHRILLEHPDWIPYLYEDKEVGSGSDALRQELYHLCEVFADFLDVVVEQRGAIPSSEMDWSTWDLYFRYVYANSPILREWVLDNITFYPDYELASLGFIVVREPVNGRVTEVWDAIAYEEEKPEHASTVRQLWPEEADRTARISQAGYPWVGTWIMRCYDGDGHWKPAGVATVAMRDAQSAQAAVHWLLARGHDLTEKTLISWLLGVIASGGLVLEASVATYVANACIKETPYQIRDRGVTSPRGDRSAPHLAHQERFLVPAFVKR